MHAGVKHATILGVVGSLSLVAYHMVANASAPGSIPAGEVLPALSDLYGGGSDHQLGRLRLLRRTMHFVDEKYVDPQRLDHDAMFDSALDLVERQVPQALFRRSDDGGLLHVSVGSYTTTLELAPIQDSGDLVDALSRVAEVLDAHLDDDTDRAEVEYALINGMLMTLDPHSVLLPPAQSEEMEAENSGEFGGLGITITMREGRLTVEYPLEDTPAYEAGLKPDDTIVRIDGQSTINMDLQEAVAKLRGKKGAPVTISVEREGWDEPRDFTIVRDTIKLNPVKGELLEGGIGYIRVSNFHAQVSDDMSGYLSEFRRDNGGEIRGLVLDLRGNPGGYLHQAIEVSDLFLDDGAIVATVERNGSGRDETQARKAGTEGDYPIIILVNANSASASEIVAGALKNRSRAVVVGEGTFGKGSVQHLYDNEPDGSKLKLTVARYLTPGDKSIQAVGIPPDIQIEQTIFMETKDDDGSVNTLAAMYSRERVTREADLDHTLTKGNALADPPVYSLRYLREVKDDDRPRSDQLDLAGDWEVQFARDLILASPADANRAEVLASVSQVVDRHAAAQATEITGAFDGIDIDWSAGKQPSSPSLDARFDMGRDEVLKAGEQETVKLWVTNSGDAPVHQVMAVCESGLGALDSREYFFGKLNPGETASFGANVQLVEGYGDEVSTMTCTFYDAQRHELAVSEHAVRTQGLALPDFAWSWTIADGGVDGTQGDGDGIVEPGEVVALQLTVTNRGDGPTSGAFVKLKNRSGRDVDLRYGTEEIGVLAPGESHTTDLLFQLKGSTPEVELELMIGDQERYDYAAVWRGGFHETFGQTENLVIPVGTPVGSAERNPPTIESSREPELRVVEPQVVLSGAARDDQGVRDVIVYQVTEDETDKIFYQGGEAGIAMVPYTVDAHLEPGANLFVVIARDADGLMQAHSVSVWYDASGSVSQTGEPAGNGG